MKSCKEKSGFSDRKIIPPDSMSLILARMALQEAGNLHPFVSRDSLTQKYCLIDTLRCSRARIDSSLFYYTQQTEVLKKIIARSLDTMEKIEKQLLAPSDTSKIHPSLH